MVGAQPKKRVQFRCTVCSAETGSVRVRCAQVIPQDPQAVPPTPDVIASNAETAPVDKFTCPDFDLCVPCFLAGKTLGPHRAHHAYRIISSHAFPIFADDWGADEELLLIEGAETFGLGNWEDIAEFVGARTREECEEHYDKIYLQSDQYPLPPSNPRLSLDQDTFQANKKRRLEELQLKPLVPPPPKPMASAPTCHEIAGFMPGRLEYETEYENEAEGLVKDMDFGKVYQFGGDSQPAGEEPVKVETIKVEGEDGEEESAALNGPPVDEPEDELLLKLAILEMLNERYDRRMAAKEIIFDRGLMNYRQIFANERKRSKEERDLVNRTKVFARLQTAQDHEEFVDGILYEATLRRRISELQEYRSMGITTVAESERYERDKIQRAANKRANMSLAPNFDAYAPSYNRISRPPSSSSASRPSTSVLTLATSNSLQLLTDLERNLCSTLRMLPRPYLFLKEVLLREWVSSGGHMTADGAKNVVGRRNGEGSEVSGAAEGEWGEKVERVWEFLVDAGGLRSVVPMPDDDDMDEDVDREAFSSGPGSVVEVGGQIEPTDEHSALVVPLSNGGAGHEVTNGHSEALQV